ncbi:MAG: pyridoxal-phosphate dependent enzyme [Candidatus Aenigmarchaeota archaeon]|nr:pyridoxal-phosphate dependent enzyme [Candidatus Aenigmarchaeota archaeon]
MEYISTNKKAPPVNFRSAVFSNVPPDGGLYMPASFPQIPVHELKGASYTEVAAEALYPFVEGEIPRSELEAMAKRAYPFAPVIVKIDEGLYMMDLGAGTLTDSFKDYGVRMQAEFVRYYGNEDLTILSITSGDTGPAVAKAFGGNGIRTVVVFDERNISDVQRRQMTTVPNVVAIGAKNDFSHLYSVGKEVENHPSLKGKLLSANSRNIGRLLGQIPYHIYGHSNVEGGKRVILSIPFGNGGNFVSAEMARRMGLRIPMLIAATNANDVFRRFVETGRYEPRPTIPTISSAMDVSDPGNMPRFVYMHGGTMDVNRNISHPPDMHGIRAVTHAVSITDAQTIETIRRAYRQRGILIDPHGGVALAGAEQFRRVNPEHASTPIIFEETATPSKFPQTMEKIVGFAPEPTESMQREALMKENIIHVGELTPKKLLEVLQAR